MQIYYYCSYEGSPAGYHIGKVETSSYDIDLQEPSCDKINHLYSSVLKME